MFVNNQKGSHGMFSKSGKRTLEKFQILMKKDEIINGIDKKVKVNDFYSPDQANNIETQEDEFKVYSQDPHEKQNLLENTLNKHKNKVNTSKINERSKSILIDYKNHRHENPPCNKYNPNFEYTKKKMCWGPKWETIKPRDFSMCNPKSLNKADNHLYDPSFKVDTHVLIKFDKMSSRQPIKSEKRIKSARSTSVNENTTMNFNSNEVNSKDISRMRRKDTNASINEGK
jgi:hypothetical protein